MIVISHHVKKIGMPYPQGVVVRVNTAWIESVEELDSVLKDIKDRKVFLDYPTGRTKPPVPKFSLDEVAEFTHKYNIDYFAFSNAQEPSEVEIIRKKVMPRTKLVPKIETKLGVHNLRLIIDAAQTDVIMLDKEDLYTDVHGNQEQFNNFVERCRVECKKLGVTCLELKGVVFGHE